MRRHILVGIGAAVGLFLVFLGIISLAQGFASALGQTGALWYWVVALTGGFGVQAGLLSFVRQGLKERRTAANTSIAASGGVSAVSMITCCAHRLTDILPFLGVAGLAAFIGRYQTLFLVIGVLSNIVGITVMLETIQRHGLSDRLARWQWDMGKVKKGAMVVSVLLTGVILVRNLLVW